MAEWQQKVQQLFALAGSTTAENEKRNALSSALDILVKNNVDLGGMLMQRAPDVPTAPAAPSCARCAKTEKRATEDVERARMRSEVRVSDLLIRVQDLERDLLAEKKIRAALERSGARHDPGPSSLAAQAAPSPRGDGPAAAARPPMTRRIPLESKYANARCRGCAALIEVGTIVFWMKDAGVLCEDCHEAEKKPRSKKGA